MYRSKIIHKVKYQVLDASQYEQLLRQGLDFFGAARFSAIPERWRGGINPPASPFGNHGPDVVGTHHQQQQITEDVLQCYRCQGFWHVAANCRHLPRCVRCGEPHSLEFCSRPRNNPICCHCSGPHHAGINSSAINSLYIHMRLKDLVIIKKLIYRD